VRFGGTERSEVTLGRLHRSEPVLHLLESEQERQILGASFRQLISKLCCAPISRLPPHRSGRAGRSSLGAHLFALSYCGLVNLLQHVPMLSVEGIA
jgi:hypothetical protein